MIIANGFIQPKIKAQTQETLIDPATGYPRKEATTASWGEKVECQFYANSYNALARALGEPRTERSYTVLIEEMPFPYEEIALFDGAGTKVGEFSIISTTPLDAVGQLKILV